MSTINKVKGKSGDISSERNSVVENAETAKIKKKKKKPQVNNSVPRFNDKGVCIKCKSSNVREESISCSICEELFHALCRDTRGNTMSSSITTKTVLDQIRPVIAKYGSSRERWGNFMFTCNKCVDVIRKKKASRTSCQQEKGCQTLDATIDDLSSSEISVNFPKESDNLLDHIGSLLGKMKTEILRDVENLMDCKLKASPEISVSPLPSEPVSIENNSSSSLSSYADVVSTAKSHSSNSRCEDFLDTCLASSSGSSTNCDKQDHVVVLSTEVHDFEVDEITKAIDLKFKNVPFSYAKKDDVSKKIILRFPSKKDANIGKELLKSCNIVNDHGYLVVDAKKIYPKITVSNVPNYLVSHIESDKESLTPTAYREQLKDFMKTKLLEKNDYIKDLTRTGEKTFEIVFINVGKDYTTLGIKVSPIIRDYLMVNKRIYIGNTSCPIYDRFFIKQCFRCQKLGHISNDCKEDHSVCMYCSATHPTSSCPNKKNKELFKCRNCAHSKDPKVKTCCDTHHSGSFECPVIMQERKRQQDRTDYSKNL